MGKKRSERTRGPYMDPEQYEKLSRLAENEDMKIQDALDELIDCCINSQGNIIVSQVRLKFN